MTKLSTRQMAKFVADGCLMFEGIVPAEVNELYLAQVHEPGVPEVPAGTPLAKAYPEGSAMHAVYSLPQVRDILDSLVGPDPLVDHHFVHLTLGSPEREALGIKDALPSQHWHQDSTIDTRVAFDVQIMWYPHDVTVEMGGTRYLPGSHLRVVSEAAIGRYQNIRGQRHVVCPAGTLLFLHHGMWHGGGSNRSDRTRHMVKVRLNPTVPQVRLWDDSDLTADDFVQQPIFWTRTARKDDDLATILCTPAPWHEADTHRLEFVNRIRLFRHLLGDDSFDADYWLSRLDNQPAPRDHHA
jgi:Phytanoyl-CoA dioxygenase (PhyH)